MASRVENRRSNCSLPVDIRLGFRLVTSVRFGLVLFPLPVHRTGQAELPHPTLYTGGSDGFVASAADSIATGWSDPVPGREFHPLKSSAFPGALLCHWWRRYSAKNNGPPPGTVFVISKTGAEKVLYSFTGGADGAYPQGWLVLDKQGNLF